MITKAAEKYVLASGGWFDVLKAPYYMGKKLVIKTSPWVKKTFKGVDTATAYGAGKTLKGLQYLGDLAYKYPKITLSVGVPTVYGAYKLVDSYKLNKEHINPYTDTTHLGLFGGIKYNNENFKY